MSSLAMYFCKGINNIQQKNRARVVYDDQQISKQKKWVANAGLANA